jgi:regulator of RNase E activity RraB
MEELLELRELLKEGNLPGALLLVEEMTEMSKDDKLNKIFSYGIILLLHLIKQQAEKRTTRSWDVSIRHSVRQIQRTNQRHKSKGSYLSPDELMETLADAYTSALDEAALEAFEGRYEVAEIAAMVDRPKILDQAIALILDNTP